MFQSLVDCILTLIVLPVTQLPLHYPIIPFQVTRLLGYLIPVNPTTLTPYHPSSPDDTQTWSPFHTPILQESTEMELRVHLAHGRVPVRLIPIPFARGSRIEYEDIPNVLGQQQPMCPTSWDVGQVISEGEEMILSEMIKNVRAGVIYWEYGTERGGGMRN